MIDQPSTSDEFYRFFQSGGILTVGDYSAMSEEARDAAHEGYQAHQAVFAALIGSAFHAPDAVLSLADDGQSARRRVVDELAKKGAAQLSEAFKG